MIRRFKDPEGQRKRAEFAKTVRPHMAGVDFFAPHCDNLRGQLTGHGLLSTERADELDHLASSGRVDEANASESIVFVT